jgi:hypothetical protein
MQPVQSNSGPARRHSCPSLTPQPGRPDGKDGAPPAGVGEWAALAQRGGLATFKSWTTMTLAAAFLPAKVRFIPLAVSAGLHAQAIGKDQEVGPERSVGEEAAHRTIRYAAFPATFLWHGLSANKAAAGKGGVVAALGSLWQKAAKSFPKPLYGPMAGLPVGASVARGACQVASGAAGIVLSELSPLPPSRAGAAARSSESKSDPVAVAAGAVAFLPSVIAAMPSVQGKMAKTLTPTARLITQAFLVPLNCVVSDAVQKAVQGAMQPSRRGSVGDLPSGIPGCVAVPVGSQPEDLPPSPQPGAEAPSPEPSSGAPEAPAAQALYAPGSPFA